MLELIFVIVSFAIGMQMGKFQAVNQDIVKQTSHMQDLIDQAYEARDAAKDLWIDAAQRAETWERRYYALLDETDEEYWNSISEENEGKDE